MSKKESPMRLWFLWLLKLSTKNPDLNLSKPVFGSLIERFLVSVSSNESVVYSSKLEILFSNPPMSFMVYLLWGISFTLLSKVALKTYGVIAITATNIPSLFSIGGFGSSDGVPFFRLNVPSLER